MKILAKMKKAQTNPVNPTVPEQRGAETEEVEIDIEQVARTAAEAASKATSEAYEKRIADIEAKAASRAKASNNMGDPTDTEARSAITGKHASEGTGINFARFVKGMAMAKLQNKTFDQVAKELMAKGGGYEPVARALGTLTGSEGGFMVPPEFAAELIPLLRSRTVVRGAGAREVPLAGSLTFNKQTGAGTAAYSGEGDVIAPSQQALGEVQLQEKELKALTVINNRLLQTASISADEFVRDDIVAVKARREDLAFLRGDGTAGTPRGIFNRMAAAHKFATTQSGAAATLAEVRSDAAKAIGKLTRADAPMLKPAWIFNPRAPEFLMGLTDGNGNAVFEAMLARGLWYGGFPYFTTTQIPTNLGGGSNESEVALVDFSEVIIGQGDMSLDVFPNGTYEEGGVVKSGVSRNQTVIRLIEYHDLIMRHEESAALMTANKWGA